MKDQTELQLAHDVQRRVALFGLEGINRDKETMPTKVRRMFFQTEMIRAAQQDEKHLNQVQHLSFGDKHVTCLGQHLVNLRDRSTFPESPSANLDNDFQREAAPANRQAARGLRFIHTILPGTSRILATVTQADDQIPSVQEHDVLPPQWITTFQGLIATGTNHLFGSIVARGYLVIVFGLSHRHLFRHQVYAGQHFTLRKACRWNFAVAVHKRQKRMIELRSDLQRARAQYAEVDVSGARDHGSEQRTLTLARGSKELNQYSRRWPRKWR